MVGVEKQVNETKSDLFFNLNNLITSSQLDPAIEVRA